MVGFLTREETERGTPVQLLMVGPGKERSPSKGVASNMSQAQKWATGGKEVRRWVLCTASSDVMPN